MRTPITVKIQMCDDELNRILNEEISVLNPHSLLACEMKYWREFQGVVLRFLLRSHLGSYWLLFSVTLIKSLSSAGNRTVYLAD